MNRFLPVIILLPLLFSCKKDSENTVPEPESSIRYFGFTLIDTYWDDPTDTEAKSNYIDEIAPFSNVADILAVNPTDDLVGRMRDIADLDMKNLLHLNEIFFEITGTNNLSGTDYDLRADYRQRWDDFVATNNLSVNKNLVAAFYIGEEPTWNGIDYNELKSVTDYVKNRFPDIPIMVVEAYPILDSLQVPESVDWVGFDHYFIKDPNTDPDFQKEWHLLKSKLSTPEQKLVVIMDSHYIDWAHGDFGNIGLNEMKDVAENYHELAKSDSMVIALIGYFWPNGFDFPESIGARGMPQVVKDEYVRIGKEITGK